ncbi:MAG: hypothetical protein ACOZNI_25385 [Myxococcota bacterium]
MPDKKPGPLALAASSLEAELGAFEDAVAEAARVKLDTRKNLERCARDVQRASDLYMSVTQRVATLAKELTTAQERALGAVTRLKDVGDALGGRQSAYVERMAAYETLTGDASAIGELVEQGPEVLDQLRERLYALAARAKEMADAARAAGFRDLAEESTGRHQQLVALANKLGGQPA